MKFNLNIENTNLSAAKRQYVAPEIYVEEIAEDVEMLAGSPDNVIVDDPNKDPDIDNPDDPLGAAKGNNSTLWFGIDSYEE